PHSHHITPTRRTSELTIVPDEMRGRVMGIWSLVFGAMIPLGSLEAASVAHWTSTPFALGFGAVICAASGIVSRIVIARRERQSADRKSTRLNSSHRTI